MRIMRINGPYYAIFLRMSKFYFRPCKFTVFIVKCDGFSSSCAMCSTDSFAFHIYYVLKQGATIIPSFKLSGSEFHLLICIQWQSLTPWHPNVRLLLLLISDQNNKFKFQSNLQGGRKILTAKATYKWVLLLTSFIFSAA